jgi:hypothetical protein
VIEVARHGLIRLDADHPHLVLLEVPDEFALELAARRLRVRGIVYREFHEPDLGNSLTAVATAPVGDDARRVFRKYPLLFFGSEPTVSALPNESATATTTATVHESRWGWHPCDYATFLEIKAYHRLLLQDLRATRRRERWEAKRPHNRVRVPKGRVGERAPIPEPRCCGTRPDRYAWVLTEYRDLRRPAATPEEVKPLDLPRDWRQDHERLRAFAFSTGRA